jgi:hypothetical protein
MSGLSVHVPTKHSEKNLANHLNICKILERDGFHALDYTE